MADDDTVAHDQSTNRRTQSLSPVGVETAISTCPSKEGKGLAFCRETAVPSLIPDNQNIGLALGKP